MAATSYVWLGCLMFVLGTHQAGWVGHDYSHHSVFASPVVNDWVASVVGCMQGYEVGWWKARHNTHHVVTNEVGNDPDIKTSPVFHFQQQFPDLARRLRNPIQRLQKYYYLPMLCVLDLYWRFESLQFIARRPAAAMRGIVLLTLHYLSLACVVLNAGWAPLVVASLVRGAGTAMIVFSTHYAEDRIGIEFGTKPAEEMSFLEQTARTSRNIAGGALLDFFSGNISFQIEHHLFPMLPRGHLPLIQQRVKALLAKYNLPYRSSSLVDCLKLSMVSLDLTTAVDNAAAPRTSASSSNSANNASRRSKTKKID